MSTSFEDLYENAVEEVASATVELNDLYALVTRLRDENSFLVDHITRWSTFQSGVDGHLHRPDHDGSSGYNPDCEECGIDWPCPMAVLAILDAVPSANPQELSE